MSEKTNINMANNITINNNNINNINNKNND